MKELIYRTSYDVIHNINIVNSWNIVSFNRFGIVVWVDDIV